jgi:hypothetical protein
MTALLAGSWFSTKVTAVWTAADGLPLVIAQAEAVMIAQRLEHLP